MKFHIGSAAMAVTVLLTPIVFAQTNGFLGIVTWEDGQPAKKVMVKIDGTKMDRVDVKAPHIKRTTDKNGRYRIYGLPLGVYDLSVEVGGKQMDKAPRVRLRLPASSSPAYTTMTRETVTTSTPTSTSSNTSITAQDTPAYHGGQPDAVINFVLKGGPVNQRK